MQLFMLPNPTSSQANCQLPFNPCAEHRVPLEWAYAAPNINWTSAFPDAVPLPDKQLLAPDAPDDGSGILRWGASENHWERPAEQGRAEAG